jgi:Flp pilus assembly protein TadG
MTQSPTMRHRCLRCPRRGSTAVEFVIVLPLLIVLCLTSVDFGRFLYAYIALGNSGRVGSEYGATRRYDSSSATAWKQHLVDASREDFGTLGGVDVSELELQVSLADDSYGLTRIAVTVSYPFMTVVSWPFIPRPLTLRRTITFRRYR